MVKKYTIEQQVKITEAEVGYELTPYYDLVEQALAFSFSSFMPVSKEARDRARKVYDLRRTKEYFEGCAKQGGASQWWQKTEWCTINALDIAAQNYRRAIDNLLPVNERQKSGYPYQAYHNGKPVRKNLQLV